MITVKTGFGYYKNTQGHIVSKAELPKGAHPLKTGLTYIEVADKTALNKIKIWIDPAIPVPKTIKENVLEALNLTEAHLTKIRNL